MKRLNLKLLIILGCLFVFGSVGVHFLHGFQVNRNAESLKNRAAQAEKDKNYEEIDIE